MTPEIGTAPLLWGRKKADRDKQNDISQTGFTWFQLSTGYRGFTGGLGK